MWQNLIHLIKIIASLDCNEGEISNKIYITIVIEVDSGIYWGKLCHPVVPPSENTLIYQQNQRYFPLRIHIATDVTE